VVVSLVLATAACGDDSSQSSDTTAASDQSESSDTTAAADQERSTYVTRAFSEPFEVTAPALLPTEPSIDEPNFVTWESTASDGPAVRFLVPVNVFPPGSTVTTPPPADYLAYLLAQAEHGAHFADQTETTVGARPATLLTATVDESLDGSLGCPEQDRGPAGILDRHDRRQLLHGRCQPGQVAQRPTNLKALDVERLGPIRVLRMGCHVAEMSESPGDPTLVAHGPRDGERLIVEAPGLLMLALARQHDAHAVEREGLAPLVFSSPEGGDPLPVLLSRACRIPIQGNRFCHVDGCKAQHLVVAITRPRDDRFVELACGRVVSGQDRGVGKVVGSKRNAVRAPHLPVQLQASLMQSRCAGLVAEH
jgi:hypothetical protein